MSDFSPELHSYALKIAKLIIDEVEKNNRRKYDVFIKSKDIDKLVNGSLKDLLIKELKQKWEIGENWSIGKEIIYSIPEEKLPEVESFLKFYKP